jgi:hypothetical protein
MQTGPDAHGIVENEYGGAKHENETRRTQYCSKRFLERKKLKRDPAPMVPPKTSSGAQNMKTGPDYHGTAENEYGSANHENENRRTRYRRKRV